MRADWVASVQREALRGEGRNNVESVHGLHLRRNGNLDTRCQTNGRTRQDRVHVIECEPRCRGADNVMASKEGEVWWQVWRWGRCRSKGARGEPVRYGVVGGALLVGGRR